MLTETIVSVVGLQLLLSMSPPPSNSSDATSDAASFDELVNDLQTSTTQASVAVNIETLLELERSIALLSTFPDQLATNARASERLVVAYLALARGYMQLDQRERAVLVIDDLLLWIPSMAHVPSRFLPDFSELLSERQAVLTRRGHSTLQVTCELPCNVSVNGFEIGAGEHELRPGSHMVALSSTNDELPPETRHIELPPGDRVLLEYRRVAPAPTLTPRPNESPPPVTPPTSDTRPTMRKFWPGWLGLGLGVAASIAGTALISIHGKDWTGRCIGENIDANGNCKFVYSTRTLGISLAVLGLGGTGFGVGWLVRAQLDAQTRGLTASVRF